MKSKYPTVSVIVPCRNEYVHIEEGVRSILNQQSPDGGFEVLVVDGMSTDGTREILQELIKDDSRLRVIDNPAFFTPHAMNAGIRESSGRFIAIMGAHTHYSKSYIQACVNVLEEHPDVWCSGGPIRSEGRSAFGRAVAVAMSHPVGVGNAKHRFSTFEGYAEGACFPMFRREVFEQIGLYDENLIRNQDDELNLRMALNGGRVYLSPLAECRYFVRDTPRRLFWQYFFYGYFRVEVLKKHKVPASFRQLVPIVFFPVALLLALACWWVPDWWAWAGCVPLGSYVLVLLATGIWVATQKGVMPGVLFPLAAFLMHAAYAVGFAWNLVGAGVPKSTK
ncbi:glycosyltransferase family 2 protein [Candidatus Nitrospira salsa]|nr:MAG: succinoglycan biosynthesis protein ExoA [Nitrospirales bacterium]